MYVVGTEGVKKGAMLSAKLPQTNTLINDVHPIYPLLLWLLRKKLTHIKTLTSGVQVNGHCIWLRFGLCVVPASMWVLLPHLSVTCIQALIFHCCRVDSQSVADSRLAVNANLATADKDFCNTVVHESSYQRGFFYNRGLRLWALFLLENWFRDWPPQPVHLSLGRACASHGDIADEGDGVASF